ncbi:MAG: hypothetical protein WBV69_01730 [Candidatus Sulfotelmatobacter sp.]
MVPTPIPSSVDQDQSSRVWSVLGQLLRHPVHSFVICWNWKAGALSIILRAPVYVITTLKYGWQAATLAGIVEALFSAAAAGVYAALTEAIRYAEPQYLVALLLLAVLPAITLCFDALVHYIMHTPNLVVGVTASLVVSIVSSAFNWYSMRRGTLLVGRAARSFTSDILALPLLIAKFLGEPVAFLWRTVKELCTALV